MALPPQSGMLYSVKLPDLNKAANINNHSLMVEIIGLEFVNAVN
jgi:hypothetical protein